eukprot:5163415-Pleurochrysis_carterae.AAC.1
MRQSAAKLVRRRASLCDETVSGSKLFRWTLRAQESDMGRKFGQPHVTTLQRALELNRVGIVQVGAAPMTPPPTSPHARPMCLRAHHALVATSRSQPRFTRH